MLCMPPLKTGTFLPIYLAPAIARASKGESIKPWKDPRPPSERPRECQMRPINRRQLIEGAALCTLAAPSASLSTPAQAANPPVLAVAEIANGVFVARGVHEVMTAENGGHIANLSFVVGSEAVAVIDTGGCARTGAALLAAIAAKTQKPVRYVINTHMHPDHVLGNAPFRATGAEFVSHAKMPRGLNSRSARYLAHNTQVLGAEFAGTEIVLPTRLVATAMDLDLGGRRLTLTAHGTAHTDNDLSIRDHNSGTLILGDLLFCEHIPTIDGSIRGWMRELDRLAGSPAERVVPGHGPASVSWPQALAPQRRYFEELISGIKDLIKNGKTLSEAVESAALEESRSWMLSNEYHRRNIATAFAELEWE